MDAVTPFASIGVGQPDWRAPLRLRSLEPVPRRIALRYHGGGLSESETPADVAHHCRIAGATHALMAPSALSVLHAQTHGIAPDNLLAVQALWGSAVAHAEIVDESPRQQAIAD